MNLLHFEIHNRRRVFSLIDVQQTCPYWMIWQYEGISDLRPDGSLFPRDPPVIKHGNGKSTIPFVDFPSYQDA